VVGATVLDVDPGTELDEPGLPTLGTVEHGATATPGVSAGSPLPLGAGPGPSAGEDPEGEPPTLRDFWSSGSEHPARRSEKAQPMDGK
jgi:hypothetical protein